MTKRPPKVREMYTVFDEMFTAAAKRFRVERPNPLKCQAMINHVMMMLRGCEQSIGELLDQERSNARHDAIPGSSCKGGRPGMHAGWLPEPLRITREGPIL